MFAGGIAPADVAAAKAELDTIADVVCIHQMLGSGILMRYCLSAPAPMNSVKLMSSFFPLLPLIYIKNIYLFIIYPCIYIYIYRGANV